MGISKEQRIAILLVIDGAFFLLELIVGYAVHSLALVADAFHMLNDVLSLCVGLWAVRVANTGSSEKYTYGWQRAETLGALVNGVFLVALCLSIFLEAIQRFVEPQQVSNPKLVLIVGCLGLASNILGLFLFHDHGHSHGHDHSHGAGSHTHDGIKDAEEGHGHSHIPISHEHDDENTPLMSGMNGKSRDDDHAVSHGRSPHPHKRKSTIGSNGIPISSHQRRTSAFGSADDIPVHPASMRQGLLRAANFEDSANGSVPEEALLDASTANEHTNNTTQDENGRPILGPSKQSHATHNHAQPKKPAASGGGHGHSHGDLNMRGVFLHVMGDALGNIGVIATALFIWLTDWSFRYYLDPAISLVITVIILCSAIPLCKAASRILLQATPENVSIEEMRQDIETLEGVDSAHHLHVWQLSDTKLVASLHVKVNCEIKEAGSEAYMRLAREIQQCLHAYGIHSSTIQPEFISDGTEGHVYASGSAHGSSHNSPTGVHSKAPSLASAKDQACMLDCEMDFGSKGQCCPATMQDSKAPDTNSNSKSGHGHGQGHAH